MITIKKLSTDEFNNLQVSEWSIWEKEVSKFDWFYDSTEECYILEGEIEVTDENNNIYKIEKNDFVRFKKGLRCKWHIKSAVRKHYRFIREVL